MKHFEEPVLKLVLVNDIIVTSETTENAGAGEGYGSGDGPVL